MSSRAKQQLPFNPLVLRWARNWAGVDVNQAAARASVDPDRIEDWEREDSETTPTVRQARKLAELYQRPFLEFFQDKIPVLKRTSLIPDFRLHRHAPDPSQQREFEKLQAWAEQQRDSALDLYEEIGESPPTFPSKLFCSIETNVETAAQLARQVMDFSVTRQFNIPSGDRDRIPNILRELIEKFGVLTLKEPSLKRLRARGFCIAHYPLPIIVFGGESPKAQAYTLMHEFAHLLLGQSAISGAITRSGGDPQVRKIEKWCNRFAAAFLMPKKEIHEFFAHAGELPFISDELIRIIANKFSVSDHAVVVRLVELNIVSEDFYWGIKRPFYDAIEENYKGSGRAAYYGTRYKNRLGPLYTRLVLQAWDSGKITNHKAAEFMGIKNLKHLNDIRAGGA